MPSIHMVSLSVFPPAISLRGPILGFPPLLDPTHPGSHFNQSVGVASAATNTGPFQNVSHLCAVRR